ncbi:ribosomal protein S18 acetylase RimI-like enzyme [Zhongshania antarctica]|uniref:Ribosomal protein S18 acetylase RimI-like enzyme n=1 Tax=Zhongshania antarctica TaxID=641702 RepID=A0A840R3E0_9GAMM|nr:GNAT family N-acetyltransferase [Zhongshania antarctica]MBB5186952.1 ribosomal protein S18 acetylase RimI-like enzyme [Zhongshania antarctica]
MIRKGEGLDFSQIATFDNFAGCRRTEISEDRLTVFDKDGDVVGFVVESRKGLLGRPYIEYLAVENRYRRQGLAAKLIQAIESKHAGKRLFISSEATNTAMLNLLKNEGYIMAGRIANANLSGADELYFFKHIN